MSWIHQNSSKISFELQNIILMKSQLSIGNFKCIYDEFITTIWVNKKTFKRSKSHCIVPFTAKRIESTNWMLKSFGNLHFIFMFAHIKNKFLWPQKSQNGIPVNHHPKPLTSLNHFATFWQNNKKYIYKFYCSSLSLYFLLTLSLEIKQIK